jgi:hypothetical protein
MTVSATMLRISAPDWHQLNQGHLVSALAGVRAALERHLTRVAGDTSAGAEAEIAADVERYGTDDVRQMALERICAVFGLTSFERDILLLCAGTELDSRFAPLCARAQGDPQRIHPTFSLALAALPDAHWSALTPSAPLRRWRLVDVDPGLGLTTRPLRIDERVLHYLVGAPDRHEPLGGVIERVLTTADLAPTHRALANDLTGVWTRSPRGARPPIAELVGGHAADREAIAVTACETVGLRLHVLPAELLPTAHGEGDALMRLWEREAALVGGALLIEYGELDSADRRRLIAVTRFAERTRGPVVMSGRERWQISRRPAVMFELGRIAPADQRASWRRILGPAADRLNGRLDQLMMQFPLSPHATEAAAMEAIGRAAAAGPDSLHDAIWDACRRQARPRLDNLAQRIDAPASWDDLVLPDAQLQLLRDLTTHVRYRSHVYDEWGFARKTGRGLGITALFAGASGTGKTMAAEVLGNELRLDLYRIDLSAVVSKYIGETEKNLRQIFDAAEDGGAVLLFDEADALFGKRSEVKDSHDRYANIEVSYLLQRMECYRGLAILTTNLKNALDTAFLRRIRFVVTFPYPDTASRAEIWRRVFPRETPTEGLRIERLAQLNVAGGTIRSIALSAAFLAAGAGEPVRMAHVERAARSEYAKLERPLTQAELAGWE